MQTIDADIVGEGAEKRTSVTATAPATPTAIPVMAKPGDTVPEAKPPVVKTTWKSKGWGWVKGLGLFIRRQPAWSITIGAWIGVVICVMVATSVIKQMTAEVAARDAMINSLRTQVEDARSSATGNRRWAKDEQARPWWTKMNKWWW